MDPDASSSQQLTQPPSGPPLFFSKLPRELRDLIYSLAFIDAEYEDRDFHIIAISEWIKKERQKRRFAWAPGGPTTAPGIPPCPLHAQLVSRQFYLEASRAFLRRARVFPAPDLGEFAKLCAPAGAALRRTLVHFTCRWEDKPWKHHQRGRHPQPPFAALRHCTALRTLRVFVVDDLFDVFREKLVFVHDLTGGGAADGDTEGDAVDFALLYGIDDLVRLTGVPDLQILPDDTSLELTLTPAELARWHGNVRALERWVSARRDEFRLREEAVEAKAARWKNAGRTLRWWRREGLRWLVAGLWRRDEEGCLSWWPVSSKVPPESKEAGQEDGSKVVKPNRRREAGSAGGFGSFIGLTSSATSSGSVRRSSKPLLTVRLPRFYQRHPTLLMVTALLCLGTVMNMALCIWLLVLLTAKNRAPTCDCPML